MCNIPDFDAQLDHYLVLVAHLYDVSANEPGGRQCLEMFFHKHGKMDPNHGSEL